MGMESQGRRVVVTGAGVVSAIGQTVDEFWSAMKSGRSGIGPIREARLEHTGAKVAARIQDFDHKARLKHIRRDKVLPYAERYSWLAAAAADEAIRQSGLGVPFDAPFRAACIIGSAAGGQHTVETASRDHYLSHMKATHPLVLVRIIGSSAAAHVGIEYGIKGPVFATCSGCSSAEHAIGIGRDYIRHGLVDVAIVGGTEASITYGMLVAMQSMHVLSHEGCHPFSRTRSGTVLGEGAGVLVLEAEAHAKARGATMLGELCGVGMTASSHDLVKPDLEGASEAMRRALDDAGLAPEAIDYINAYGTATAQSDLNETKAIKAVFGRHAYEVGVSSTKSMHGYAMGASGGLEAVACLMAMRDGCMPPTIGLDQPDPECDLDYVPNHARTRRVDYTMSSSFGLSGLNAVLVLGPPPA